jgi:hypothetical protein
VVNIKHHAGQKTAAEKRSVKIDVLCEKFKHEF